MPHPVIHETNSGGHAYLLANDMADAASYYKFEFEIDNVLDVNLPTITNNEITSISKTDSAKKTILGTGRIKRRT